MKYTANKTKEGVSDHSIYSLSINGTSQISLSVKQRRTGGRQPKTPPGSHEMDPSAAAARCLQPAHTIRTHPGVSAALSAFLSLVTLTCDLDIHTRRDFCTTHLTAKFHRPMFNRSEVIVLTNKLTNRRR